MNYAKIFNIKKLINMAYSSASKKACEALYPPERRLFQDEYIIKLLTPGWRFQVNLLKNKFLFDRIMKFGEKLAPGVQNVLMCRVRYIDEVLRDAINAGFNAVVNLGAGFDSRSLRIEGIESLKIFEIDHPTVIAEKSKRLKKAGFGIPVNLELVPIDFNKFTLKQGLEKAGYDPSLKTLFIWEGVTQYVTKEAVESTLRYISQTKAGSRVVFTYVLQEFIENPESFPGLTTMYKQIKDLWVNGMDPATMKNYLKKFGLKLLKDAGAEYYREHYLKPLNRDLAVTEIERIVLASNDL
jgi:methyltransferase (TIGR00027 family)